MTEEEIRADERERCAKIAEAYDKHPPGYKYVAEQVGRAIALLIRKKP